jgi:phage-related minor tail protein
VSADVKFILNFDSGNAGAELGKLETQLKRLGGMRPLDAAREVLNVRSFKEIGREIGLVNAAYNTLARSGTASAAELKAAEAARLAAVARLRSEMGAVESSISGVGNTSKQTAMAMRLIPMQMTDVVTQLAGGQNPFLIMIQQGGQMKDMFGGFGPMFKQLATFFTPVKIAAGAAAAGVGLLTYALFEGRSEATEMATALRMTNNAAGLSVNTYREAGRQVQAMSGVSIDLARDSLQLSVAMGIGQGAVTSVAAAVAAYSKASGLAVDQSAQLFNGIGRDALAWSTQMAEKTHHLTLETYAQIKSLQDQGRAQEAAALAADTLREAIEKHPPQLGVLQTALKDGATAWAEFWDWAKGLGAPEQASDAIDDLAQKLRVLRGEVKFGEKGWALPYLDLRNSAQKQMIADQLLAQQADLQEQQRMGKRLSNIEAERTAREGARIEARRALDQDELANNPLKARVKLLDELNRRRDLLAGTAQAMTDAEYARAKADIVQRTTDQRGLAEAQANADLRLALAKAASAAEVSLMEGRSTALDAMRKQDIVSARAAAQEEAKIAVDSALLKQRGLQAELDVLRTRSIDASPGAATKRKAEITALESEIAQAAAAAERAWVTGAANVGQINLNQARESMQAWAASYAEMLGQNEQMADAVRSLQIQMIKNPIEQARAQAEQTIKQLQRSTEKMVAMKRVQADVLTGQGNVAEAAALIAQIEELERASLQRYGIERKKVDFDIAKNAAEEWKKATEKLNDSLTDALMRGFESGNGFAQNFGNTLQNMFKTMVLRPVISAAATPFSAALNGFMGSTSGIGGAGSLAGLGVGTFGSGLNAGFSALAGEAGFAGAFSAGTTAIGAGNVAGGLGTLAGAAGPYLAAAYAIYSIAKGLDNSGTNHAGFLSTYSEKLGLGNGSTSFVGVQDESTKNLTDNIAQSIGKMLDSAATTFGKTGGFNVQTGFADDSSSDGAWGALRIALGDQKLSDWADTQTSRWAPKEFSDGAAGKEQYLADVAKDVRAALNSIGLPDWAQSWLDQLGATPTLDQLAYVVDQINAQQKAMESVGDAAATAVEKLGTAIEDEINRIRGLMSGADGGEANLAQMMATFATKSAAARAGDQNAIDELPGISKSLLDVASENAASREDLIRIQAQTMASLQATLDAVRGSTAAAEDLRAKIPEPVDSMKTAQSASESAASEMAAMRRELAAMREENAAMQGQIVANTGSTSRQLNNMNPNGDGLNVYVYSEATTGAGA